MKLFRGAVLLLVVASVFFGAASAQGVFGLSNDAVGYLEAVPGTPLTFPRDHREHDGYRIEWWYVTANLEDEAGRRYGVQWTLFRTMIAPPADAPVGKGAWRSPYVYMGHAAVTSASAHRTAERFARGGVGQAAVGPGGAAGDGFHAFIDEWSFRAIPGADDAMSRASISAGGDDFSYRLELDADGPVILHGDGGFSRKSNGPQASYYYSQPFFRASGEIVIDGEPYAVAGEAWLDREWSSRLLADTQKGWDWFSLSFADGRKAMLFRLRDATHGDFYAGTLISADGDATTLAEDDIEFEPVRSRRRGGVAYPVAWRVRAPKAGIDVAVRALNEDAFMQLTFPYWEGPIIFEGSGGGVGYLEMTGYEATRPN